MTTWVGTVTATSPVAVARDGSSVGVPVVFVGVPGLVVGDRVLILQVGSAAHLIAKHYA